MGNSSSADAPIFLNRYRLAELYDQSPPRGAGQ